SWSTSRSATITGARTSRSDHDPRRLAHEKPRQLPGLFPFSTFEKALVQVHAHQKLPIARHLFQSAFEQFHGLDGVHIAQHAAETIDQLEFLWIKQQLFAAGA